MKYASIFRRDGDNHAVLSMRPNVRMNGKSYTICAKRVDSSFQVRIGNWPHTVITCDPCVRAVVALNDLDEATEAQ